MARSRSGETWTREALREVGLRAPSAREELFEVLQRDTFGGWPLQLRLAIRDGRSADVESIASLRPPSHVVLRHLSIGRYRTSGAGEWGELAAESTEQVSRDELLPISESERVSSCRPLPRLPRPASWRGRRLRRQLLRKPLETEGSCLFWVEDLDTLKLLERLGADTHDLGWMGIPLLVHTAEKGLHDVVVFLVEERGHSPNATRQDGGYSALHWARELETVRYLMDRGADARALTTWGDSVLAQQLRHDHAATVDHLLSLGEERASRAKLLHWLGAQPRMLRVLIRHGVSLEDPIEPRFGERHRPRPLQRVLRSGLEETRDCRDAGARRAIGDRVVESVELVLSAGVDPRVRDCAHRLPYHLVQDLLPDPEDPLRLRLDRLLAPFDGPRQAPPAEARCTCGLNL